MTDRSDKPHRFSGDSWRVLACSPMGYAVENVNTREWSWYESSRDAHRIASIRNQRDALESRMEGQS